MSIFQRIRLLVSSNINALISKAENPEKILEQLIIDMRKQFSEAKTMVAGAIADEKRLRAQFEAETQNAAEWEKKAMLAVRAGNEELAKEALMRKSEHDTLAAQFQEQWQGQKAAVDKLRTALYELNDKIEEARRKKNMLIARAKRAEAQKKIQGTMSGLSDTSAFDTFDRMADKVSQKEAEAEAATELATDLRAGDDLDRKFRELEKTHSADDALASLKAKMGLAAPAKVAVPAVAGGEGSAERDELDALFKS